MSSIPRVRHDARFFESLTVAAEAVLHGSTNDCHLQTLAAHAAREGLDELAFTLTVQHGPIGGLEWWRCTLLLATKLSPHDALVATRKQVALEENGLGPSFDAERHALHVSCTLEWLDAHLHRVLSGAATDAELDGVASVLRRARVAQAWVRTQR